MKIKNNINESGIAIIIALGFMAILLFLVLSFVNLTITNKKMSKNYSSLQTARSAAETAYQRAITIINLGMTYPTDNTSIDLTKIYSTYKNDTDADSDDLYDLLETTVNGAKYIPIYASSGGTDPDTGPHWQYLPIDHGNDIPITARLAYVVIVDEGKIDPSAAVDSAVYGKSASELETDSTSYNVLGRPGRNINEIFLTSLPNWFTDTYAEEMSASNATPSGLLPSTGRWSNFLKLEQALGIAGTETADSFRTVFVLNNTPDAEAFWIDNGDYQQDNSELYHRFNLARTDWNDITVDSFTTTSAVVAEIDDTDTDGMTIPWLKNWKNAGDMGSATNARNQIIANLIDYNDSNDSATTDDQDNPTYVGLEKVPYINELWFHLSGQNSLSTIARLTVGPNLGTAFDGEITVTNKSGETISSWDVEFDFPHDITAGNNWDCTLISHVGDHYVIHNAGGNGTLAAGASTSFGFASATPGGTITDISNITSSSLTSDPSSYYNESVVQFAKLDLELINIYNTETINTTAEISITGSYNWTLYYAVSDPTTNSKTFDETINLSITSNSQDYDTARYDISEDVDNTLKFVESYHSTEEAISSNITDFTISSLKVKLKDAGNNNLQDYAFIISNGNTPQTITADGTHEDWFYDSQINDPRQNLLESDWSERNWSTIDADSSIDAINSICIPQDGGVDSDLETAPEPWNISTAFIRNAPMQSPWELGLIHRGANWQTINLKAYSKDASGGGSYFSGDANILDQIKMSSDNTVYGKINLNTESDTVLNVLFEKIYVGSDIKSSKGPGDMNNANEINADSARYLINKVLEANGTTDPNNSLYHRSEIATFITETLSNILPNYDNSNDAQREELIGKFINLTKAEKSNFFSVISVGQAVRDTDNGEGNAIGTYMKFNKETGKGDPILSTQKTLITIQWYKDDDDVSRFKTLKFQYFTD